MSHFSSGVCVCVCVCVQSCPIFATPWTVAHQAFVSGKNTGVGCHFLLQGIFPTQGSNLQVQCLLHWETDSIRQPPGSQLSSYVRSVLPIKTASTCSSLLDVCPKSCSIVAHWALHRPSSSPRSHLLSTDFYFGLLHLSFQSPSKRAHMFLLFLSLQRKDDLLSSKPAFWVLPATTNYDSK